MNSIMSVSLFVMVTILVTVNGSEHDKAKKMVLEVCKAHPNCLQNHGLYYSNITKNYEGRRLSCRHAYQVERQKTDEETLSHCRAVATGAREVCQISSCFGYPDNSTVLKCLETRTELGKKLMFDINAKATACLQALTDQYGLIEGKESRCLQHTKEIFETATIESNDQFTSCLSTGKWTLQLNVGNYPPIIKSEPPQYIRALLVRPKLLPIPISRIRYLRT